MPGTHQWSLSANFRYRGEDPASSLAGTYRTAIWTLGISCLFGVYSFTYSDIGPEESWEGWQILHQLFLYWDGVVCLVSTLPFLNSLPASLPPNFVLLLSENRGGWLDDSQLHSVWKHSIMRLLGHQILPGFCTHVVHMLFIMSYMSVWGICGFQDFSTQIFRGSLLMVIKYLKNIKYSLCMFY